MKIAGDYTFKLPIQTVWDGIFDPEILAASLPGCESLERDGDLMRGELVIKIGPVKGKLKGTVEFSDVVAPRSCSMAIDGKGSQGFVKATATIALESRGDETILRYESDSKVGGKLASVGQRLIGASARAIAKESLESLNETLADAVARERGGEEEPELEEVDEGDGDGDDGEPERRELRQKSQAAFAAGVAQKMARDLVPLWLGVLLALVAVGLIGWLVYSLVA